MLTKTPVSIAAEKRAQAAIARSVMLRLLAADGLKRLDGDDLDAPRVEAAASAHVALNTLLDLLSADVARLDA